MRPALTILFTAIILLTISCNRHKRESQVLAEIGNEKLLLSDIYIPTDIKGNDSIVFIKNVVEQWIINQLIYEEAKTKLSKDELNVEREIEDMRRKLITARYEEKILADSTMISISEADMQKYYNDNEDEFMLKDNIVKVQYIKIAKGNKHIPEIKNMLQNPSVENNQRLKELSNTIAENAFLDDKAWLYFNDIIKEIPIKTFDQEEFLENNKFVEITQDSTVYLLNIRGYMIRDSRSPYILVKNQISTILSAKRKKDKLSDYRNKIYKAALSEKKIKTYL